MTDIFARKALLQKGWADNVRFGINAGRITDLTPNKSPESADFVAGIVIPGLCNAHSHAFQRALAGRTEERSPAGQDSFWTWRERMYELAARMDAESLAAIAAQAYSEMLASGYTSVAEFHYLHRESGSEQHDGAMFNAICQAANNSGIGLTYVPVLYERAGFDKPKPEGQQKFFALDVESFLEHHARASEIAGDRVCVGIGAHSLRAVGKESLLEIAAAATDAKIPLHLHIAEQQREVDECLSVYGRRPVSWLLDNFDVDNRWCLVHATHMDADETKNLANSGAVVCLCPSTEANLGDGLFPLHDYLINGGQIAIGSDSHISINPFEELRWLEYGQRLAAQCRNVVSLEQSHVGHELFSRVLTGGASACAQESVGLQVGASADLVTLYDADPMLVGHDGTTLLDALVFSGYRLPIERVMVGGDWRVVDGKHVDQEDTRAAYAATLERLGAVQ
ncbi:MAG: formimidoylglutamate deiminase [Gammaproteobacteria bacterium]|nr:formimidoylglutamate deiminase [Gammaproteobacteria bacterium]MDH3410389.1 formimidoylglutamate deiminase [Gammaproteobacteria bacterium]MDH3551169.1 formimidoylglutamate deiminase [Gammaproteobacteria bacterium]